MKKKNKLLIILLFAILTIFLISSSLSAFQYGQSDDNLELSYTLSFTKPVCKKVKIGGEIFDTVILGDLPNVGNYGEPLLPIKELKILIPYHYQVVSIGVDASEMISLGSGYMIEPKSKDIPLSELGKTSLPIQNHEIYNTSKIFPGNLFDTIGTYGFRGYQILILTINPVQYKPMTGELFYSTSITLTIQIEKNSKIPINDLYRNNVLDKNELKQKVDNFEKSETYPSLERQILENYDLLIITTDFLKTSFESLAEYHNSHNVSTIIKTLSDIGSNDPEAIRSYIRNAYLNWNIEYVLIGGDSDIVPARMLWVSGYGYPTVMPSDLYYACLDGTYNYDGDDRWGEPHDGENGEDVDLIAEVYIGRACVEDCNEVDNFIHKTISYVYSNDSYLDNALMAGEYLWDNPDTWGGDYMDELIDGSSNNGYTTIGLPSEEYTIDTLYDRDWPNTNDWPKEEIIDRINQNVHIINHLGHSSFYYNMKMNNSDADALTNTRYFFAYSQGCDNGGFDNPYGFDCIAEHFTVKTDHGAFAVIANARSGWGSVGSTDGASQCYHREFIDAIFGENIIQLGKANQDSKEDNLYRINQQVMRWCYYQLNLFGDPTIDFFTHYSNSPPTTPDIPSGQTNGEVGVNYTYNIHAITDPEGDVTYYKFFWGNGESSQWLGPYTPSENVTAHYSWQISGEYPVTVKCRDIYWGISNFSDSLNVQITGPFFEIGKISGGLFTASVEIKNIGAGVASSIKRSIMVKGGLFNKIFVVTNSTLDSLSSGETTIVQTDKPIIGFGKVQITATVYSPGGEVYSKTVDGHVFLFYILIS